MVQHILNLIWNERRRNWRIFVALLIAFVPSWIIIDSLFENIYNRLLPMGYDMDDLYVFHFDSEGAGGEDFVRVWDRFFAELDQFPGIEAKCVSRNPYSLFSRGGYMSNEIRSDTTKGALICSNTQVRQIDSKEFFEVVRRPSLITGNLVHMDVTQPNLAIVSSGIARCFWGDSSPIGRKIYVGDEAYRVIDVISPEKRMPSYAPQELVYLSWEPDSSSVIYNDFCIRVGKNFDVERFKRLVAPNIRTLSETKEEFEFIRGITAEQNMFWAVMLFILLNIALGVFGSFWLRNQTRCSEIAIRMAVGASRGSILRLYVGEALIIFLASSLLGCLVNLGLFYIGVVGSRHPEVDIISSLMQRPWPRFAVSNVLTFALLALVVVLSACIPAYKASKIKPADALLEE